MGCLLPQHQANTNFLNLIQIILQVPLAPDPWYSEPVSISSFGKTSAQVANGLITGGLLNSPPERSILFKKSGSAFSSSYLLSILRVFPRGWPTSGPQRFAVLKVVFPRSLCNLTKSSPNCNPSMKIPAFLWKLLGSERQQF